MSLLESGDSLSNPRARLRAQGPDHRHHHHHENAKSAGLCEAGSSNQRIIIDVKDDDDEVQVLSPRSVAQARNSRHNRRGLASPTSDSADLELRLGSSVLQGTNLASSSQRAAGGARSTRVSKITTIDLTSGNDDDVIPLALGKQKAVQLPPEPPKDIQLTCAICMDTMKEETSTVCGHIFCRSCILGAIQTQKKCPSCRRKLTNSNIHRIYLDSGSR